MPNFVPKINPAILAKALATPPAIQQEAHINDYAGGLRVVWKNQKYDVETSKVKFYGGVTAYYGPTILKCEELELWLDEYRGEAKGSVHVDDPDGTFDSKNFIFNWKLKTAQASPIQLRVDRLEAKATFLDISQDRWILEGIYLTTSKARRPDFAIGAKKVTVRPGRTVKFENPELTFLGQKIRIPFTVPISLDKRVEGLRAPSLSFRRGAGLGLAWQSGAILSEGREGGLTKSLSADLSVFPRTLPISSITYVISGVRPSASTGFVKPRSELLERFSDSALESIIVKTALQERRFFQTPRRTVAIGMAYNQDALGRRSSDNSVSKRLEVTGEVGGPIQDGGIFGQLRLQDIRVKSGTAYQVRAVGLGSFLSPNVRIGPKLEGHIRLDSHMSVGAKSNGFGWLRGAAVLGYQPTPGLTLGGQVFDSLQAGSPAFELDRLYANRGVNLRADVKRGPYGFSALWKYDFDRGKWYDTEFTASFAAGSYEPYFTTKLFPRTYIFGVRLRAEDLFDRLAAREVKRKKGSAVHP
ncbi:MAG: hypothetical protein K8R88_12085 [Armatimonadetes bacterium]|nr:hypothetical protein [Armatimonadota bacterium]